MVPEINEQFDHGYKEGYEDGFQKGMRIGYLDGYDEGYNYAKQEIDSRVLKLNAEFEELAARLTVLEKDLK